MDFLSNPILRQEPFLIDSRELSAQQVIESLAPQLTDERRRRIHEVVSRRTYNVVSVLENIYDRGNISAVMRSAEAFGFIDFRIVEKPEARFKVANRVTQGTDKWLDVRKYPDATSCVRSLKDQGIKVYATHLEASVPIDEIDFTQPSAVVFGNEKDGVSPEMLDLADGRFILPMQGFAQSFNISVAAALTFYHIYKQRQQKLGRSGDLSEHEKQILEANYYLRDKPYFK